jgi:flagellar biosynthesis anti-sigma factor FlgM
MELPDTRLERVAQLKQMIASGRYQVNAKEVADAILHG